MRGSSRPQLTGLVTRPQSAGAPQSSRQGGSSALPIGSLLVTASGNVTVPAGARKVRALFVPPGGTGGTAAGSATSGGGGAAGEVRFREYTVTPGSTLTATINSSLTSISGPITTTVGAGNSASGTSGANGMTAGGAGNLSAASGGNGGSDGSNGQNTSSGGTGGAGTGPFIETLNAFFRGATFSAGAPGQGGDNSGSSPGGFGKGGTGYGAGGGGSRHAYLGGGGGAGGILIDGAGPVASQGGDGTVGGAGALGCLYLEWY